jgi:hypothetical protein
MVNTDESNRQGGSAQDNPTFEGRWLVLIAQLPAKPDYLRVKLRRRIQRVGALSLKGAVYVLPNRAEALEDFAWLRGELIDDGGDAIVCAARTVIGTSDAELESRFRELRAADYREIIASARTLTSSTNGDEADRELSRLRRRLDDVSKLDFFGSPVREDAHRAVQHAGNVVRAARQPALSSEPAISRRTWVTRAGIFVDRIASAWLIRRFIDREATFKFASAASYSPQPSELRFDMYQAEYTHEGDHCTFETLLDRFGLNDPALRAIAEIVHDIDCKDDKFARPEAPGVELVLRGLVSAEPSDAARIERGAALFDGLLSQLGASAGS